MGELHKEEIHAFGMTGHVESRRKSKEAKEKREDEGIAYTGVLNLRGA